MLKSLIISLTVLLAPMAANAEYLNALPSQGQRTGGTIRLGDTCGGYPLLLADTPVVNAFAVWDPEYGDAIIITAGMRRQSPAAQRFFLAHECGHFRMGHIIRQMIPPAGMSSHTFELEADCFATRDRMKANDAAAVDAFIRALRHLPTDEHHSGWQKRAANIRRCQQG